MKKVCIVTGTRAEYGLLKPIVEKVHRADGLELQLVVTGMHLSTEFGLTYREIEEDGYPIKAKIEMLLSSDTAVGITKSMGIALLGFADYFENNKPDIVIVLGDRYEMLVVASAAMAAGIPIAHIGGGEKTEGAIDEAIRHSITKMSQLHFTATEEYRKRVIQLGEQPETVYNVGALGIENIKTVELMGKRELEESLEFQFTDHTIMLTYHPVTMEVQTAEKQFRNILDAIDRRGELSVIFTKANSDADGRIINRMIDEYAAANSDRCTVHTSLGQVRYLSALQFCRAVVGNSSSGIIEAPSFHIPTVNIGIRQLGRVRAASVIDCGNETQDILAAIDKAETMYKEGTLHTVANPYEGENTSRIICQKIAEYLEKSDTNIKKFYDLHDMN